MPKIKFGSARPYNNEQEYKEVIPQPIKKFMPEWWNKATKYWLAEDGEYIPAQYPHQEPEERSLGFKSCPALLDIFSAGYTLRTPTDIMFVQYNNEPFVKIDEEFKDFCDARHAMPQFVNPHGYHSKHFHWWPNWGIELPKGYSALVTSPLNRFDLPFLTVAGIIDSDKYTMPGLMPFFLKEGFSGLIPKGTPYAQIIPIKREDWDSEHIYYTNQEMYDRHVATTDKYRIPYGGVYKQKTWEKKNYE
jgi:hypothetical protein